MATIRTDDVRYQQARERVEELKGFYVHLAMFLVFNAGLFLINYVTSNTWWFYWPLLGWGIGLTAHALAVFAFDGRFGRDWEQRKLRQLMEEDDGTP